MAMKHQKLLRDYVWEKRLAQRSRLIRRLRSSVS